MANEPTWVTDYKRKLGCRRDGGYLTPLSEEGIAERAAHMDWAQEQAEAARAKHQPEIDRLGLSLSGAGHVEDDRG